MPVPNGPSGFEAELDFEFEPEAMFPATPPSQAPVAETALPDSELVHARFLGRTILDYAGDRVPIPAEDLHQQVQVEVLDAGKSGKASPVDFAAGQTKKIVREQRAISDDFLTATGDSVMELVEDPVNLLDIIEEMIDEQGVLESEPEWHAEVSGGHAVAILATLTDLFVRKYGEQPPTPNLEPLNAWLDTGELPHYADAKKEQPDPELVEPVFHGTPLYGPMPKYWHPLWSAPFYYSPLTPVKTYKWDRWDPDVAVALPAYLPEAGAGVHDISHAEDRWDPTMNADLLEELAHREWETEGPDAEETWPSDDWLDAAPWWIRGSVRKDGTHRKISGPREVIELRPLHIKWMAKKRLIVVKGCKVTRRTIMVPRAATLDRTRQGNGQPFPWVEALMPYQGGRDETVYSELEFSRNLYEITAAQRAARLETSGIEPTAFEPEVRVAMESAVIRARQAAAAAPILAPNWGLGLTREVAEEQYAKYVETGIHQYGKPADWNPGDWSDPYSLVETAETKPDWKGADPEAILDHAVNQFALTSRAQMIRAKIIHFSATGEMPRAPQKPDVVVKVVGVLPGKVVGETVLPTVFLVATYGVDNVAGERIIRPLGWASPGWLKSHRKFKLGSLRANELEAMSQTDGVVVSWPAVKAKVHGDKLLVTDEKAIVLDAWRKRAGLELQSTPYAQWFFRYETSEKSQFSEVPNVMPWDGEAAPPPMDNGWHPDMDGIDIEYILGVDVELDYPDHF